jgi:hypothetical protein
MLYFPQLSSGAMGQYPIIKRFMSRTVVNQCPDGSQVKLSDPLASAIEWDLTFSALTDDEWGAIAGLFAATEGRLQNFLFLDPDDNLLTASEALSVAAWSAAPGLRLTGQAADPLGTNRATTVANTGPAAQQLQQSLEIPPALQYCFSVYARSNAPTPITLFQCTTAKNASTSVTVEPAWRRLILSDNLNDVNGPINFGIELNAGAQVDVFGLQVEAQPGPSAYKMTTNQGGVYPSARFQDDSIQVTTTGISQHACVVRIVSWTGGED